MLRLEENIFSGAVFHQLAKIHNRNIDVYKRQPFWLSFCSDKKTQTLKAFAQTELYNKDEKIAMEKGSLILDRSSGQASVKAVQEIGENMGVFYAACQKLSCFIQKKKLEPLYENLNPDEAGILLVKNNDELSWKVVSGRERPSLTVQTLFGGITTVSYTHLMPAIRIPPTRNLRCRAASTELIPGGRKNMKLSPIRCANPSSLSLIHISMAELMEQMHAQQRTGR